MVLLTRADWLDRKWIVTTIHLLNMLVFVILNCYYTVVNQKWNGAVITTTKQLCTSVSKNL